MVNLIPNAGSVHTTNEKKNDARVHRRGMPLWHAAIALVLQSISLYPHLPMFVSKRMSIPMSVHTSVHHRCTSLRDQSKPHAYCSLHTCLHMHMGSCTSRSKDRYPGRCINMCLHKCQGTCYLPICRILYIVSRYLLPAYTPCYTNVNAHGYAPVRTHVYT